MLTVKPIFIAGLGAALVASSTYAQQTQVVGQPVLRAPAPMAPEDLRSHPNFGQPATKLPRAARAPSTPESRSAAALALSADPVFDEGTYQRIKETLLSYAAVQVRGPGELEQTLADLLSRPERRAELGKNALAVVRENQGAVARTVDMIVDHLADRDFYIVPQKS